MKKRLLVTGYGGFVAGSVVRQAAGAWDVCAVHQFDSAPEIPGVRRRQLELRDTARLREFFAEEKPDAVIHMAALADIDYCQNHQDEAEQVNVGVTAEIARLCGRSGAKMIACSTDTVFDGAKGRYTEDDQPHPVNFYGETKVRAEKAVRELAPGSVVARLSLVVGLPVLGAGNSFLAKMVESLEARREVRFPQNEIRTPIDVITLGRALLELAGSEFHGTIHLAGCTRLNRHEMGLRIAERLGYPGKLVVATDSNSMPGRAARPNDASLDNSLARRTLRTPMLELADALELILSSREK
ncbi:MAG TPA: NAD(P)-dependent oxidoreductase [Candidatus Brocadiia bacterium]|nr:NAD(P)-dependent oxidoreductase [Candidatus Brocadiia bacterium]